MVSVIIKALYFFLPAYFANMAPVLFKNKFLFLKKPIDNNLQFKGKPLFGSHKTWRGLIVGIMLGWFVFWLQRLFYADYALFRNISLFDYSTAPITLGLLLAFGALFGDLVESLVKRRISIAAGKPWYCFDQLDYVIGGLLLSLIVYTPPFSAIITILLFSPLLTVLVNYSAYYLKIRKTKW
ncbi:CDP-archaeol synthase [Candidatus Woesearchaeota archaeon]|nr:CDP-archaeol synthase [Candidatus Woesearchaeota archaeon]